MRPSFYVPLPALWAIAPKVERLRAMHGTLAMAVFPVLLAEAEIQTQAGGQRGWVRMTYGRLAGLVDARPAEVRGVVTAMADLGALEPANVTDEYEFSAHWRDWDVWSPVPAALATAMDFLGGLLTDGREVPVSELQAAAAATVPVTAWRTLERAKLELGVESRKSGRTWLWRLNTAKTANTATK